MSPALARTPLSALAEHYDLVIVGGGITGAGILREAIRSGSRVLLVEARDFAIAGRMLELLNIPRIRLMTNNPEKVARLEKEGVAVVERIPLALPTNKYNEQYLATKRDRTGHQL